MEALQVCASLVLRGRRHLTRACPVSSLVFFLLFVIKAELAALRAELPMLLLVPEDTAAVAGLCAELQTPLRHAKTLRQRTLVRPLVPRLAAQPDELDVPGVRCALRGARYACSVPSCAQRFRLESQMEAHVAMHHSLGPARSAGPAPLTWDQVDRRKEKWKKRGEKKKENSGKSEPEKG